MDIVIDVEMFSNNIVKELGICSGTYNAGFLLKPPHSFEQCTEKDKQTNSWLMRNFHEIAWNAGTYEYCELPTIIQTLNRPNAVFYAKGMAKCSILSILFQKIFINLDDRGCPTAIELVAQQWAHRIKCDSYPGRHGPSIHCAQKKAIMYHDWLSDNNYDEFACVF